MNKQFHLQLIDPSSTTGFVSFHLNVQWVRPDGSVRIPESSEKTFSSPVHFTAAGKEYFSLKMPTAVKADASGHVFRDIYGRHVFALRERFPCFDSYDYLNEGRYYRWFYICTDSQITCVYYEDTYPTIRVTEDISRIKRDHAETIEKYFAK